MINFMAESAVHVFRQDTMIVDASHGAIFPHLRLRTNAGRNIRIVGNDFAQHAMARDSSDGTLTTGLAATSATQK